MLKISGTSENNKVNEISKKIISIFDGIDDIYGDAYIGYPIYAIEYTNDTLCCDLAIVSNVGVYIFNILSEKTIDYTTIQDDLYIKIESKFKKCKFLLNQRRLSFDFTVLTYSLIPKSEAKDGYLIFDSLEELESYLLENKNLIENEKVNKIASALQEAHGLNKRSYHETAPEGTKAFLINKMNNIIEKHDEYQMTAITEDPTGIQRIRGMAGSGKTVILARKAVELHTAHPEWTIVVTYFTRSLKNQLIQLIEKFYKNKNDGMRPNYDKLKIMHAWGSSSSDGVYYDVCKNLEIKSYTFYEAKRLYPSSPRPFNELCRDVLKEVQEFPKLYDCILIDEAQDFDKSFLNLCCNILGPEKRLVYAYDELQNLNELSMESPEKIFGFSISKDTPLRTCYRNQSSVIVTAHALGMGLYRQQGMIQIPSTTEVWESIGYKSNSEIIEGSEVTLYRDLETSPNYLEQPEDGLIKMENKEGIQEVYTCLLNEIKNNIENDKLNPEDIMIIDLDGKEISLNFSILQLMINKDKESFKGVKIHQAASSNPEDFFRKDSIVYSSIYRAKGNEAYYVYIVNAQKCIETLTRTKDRNSIFTAITRSKGWVNIYGYGDSMDELIDEFNKVKEHNFKLHFDSYPTESERALMVQTNQDLSQKDTETISDAKEIFGRLKKDNGSLEIALKELLGEDYQSIIKGLIKDEK